MRLIRIGTFLVIAAHSVAAQQGLPALMDSAGIPGMSIALVENGTVSWIKSFGVRGADGSALVDENTVFEAASLSKPVVAYAALKLVDAGKLDLDRPLREYIAIPELTDPRANRITTRMVLSHSTGLQNERINNEPLALAFDPGEKFRYSGEGFRLLQRVLESITRESLDRLTRRHVFDPLGMTRSSFVWREDFAGNAAIGHGDFRSPRNPTRPSAARAPSSLHTTVRDYARFVRAMMQKQGLRSGTFKEIMKPQVQVAPGVAWGLGWALADSARIALHWGDNSNSGFTALVLINTSQKKAVLYFANSATGLGIMRRVAALAGASHAPLQLLGYEAYDAPTRRVRLAVEEAVRLRGADGGLAKYDSLKSQLDPSVFPESLLNGLGYRFLSLKRPQDAVALFQRNVELFPRSSNAFDSLGDGLIAAGNNEAAVTSYLKSYELDPRNERALQEANRLRAKR